MKQQYYLPLCLAIATAGLCGSAKAQYSRTPGYQTKPVTERIESNWLLNVGVGYGNYYGDMSNYRIRRFEDIGLLRNFVNYNNNYIQEPSFHLSVAKRLMGNTGIGFNFNRTLIQSSDRYIRSNGTIQTSNPNFARSLNFQTDILDAGLSLNLNGFTRGFFAPYLSLGAGVSFFDVKGDVFTGPNQNQVYNYAGTQNVNDGIFETNLRNARTETEERYPNKAIYAQALLGFNFQLARTFSLALEADVKYSGSDYLDDLSGTYKTSYPSLQNAYIAKPGPNAVNPITSNRGYNDGVNDFYIQTRVVFRFHIPKYITRSEARKIRTRFNAPVLYPNNYPVNAVDSSAYLNTLNRMKYNNGAATDTNSVNAGGPSGRKATDSIAMANRDSLRADSLSNRNTYNVKMDSAYVNELKALRQEITGLRQAISAATPRSKDSIQVRRATIKDSLQQSLKSLQDKKRKTPSDSLQLRIYQLRLDSISLVEKYTARDAGTTKTSGAAAVQPPVAAEAGQPAALPAVVTGNNNVTREDSLRKVIDSLRNLNTAAQQQTARTTPSGSVAPRTIRNVRDTMTAQQTRQYEQQIAALTYRSRQAGTDNRQQQKQQDSIRTISAAIRASDSLKVIHYQNQLTRARQLEERTKEAEPRKGLLVRKSDEVREAEENRRQVEERLKAAQVSQQQNSQGARVAAGDTAYVAGLQQQITVRQAQIDSLKSSRKVTDVFSSKNRRIRELEEAQEQQRKEAAEANRLLQYYRNNGPTSYTQPVYDQRDYNRQFNDMNDRIRDLQRLQTLSYIQQPVNAVSPVVVSGNNDDKKERERMQSEIDSLRSQLNQLSQAPRRDTIVQRDTLAARPVTAGVDTALQRSMAAANQASTEMSAIQLQLAELSRQMSERRTQQPATSSGRTDTATRTAVFTTVYFNRGSAILAALQKAKLSALVKKNGKAETYRLTSSTDNTTGNTAANEALAQKRVTSVAGYLRTLGIPTGQISTIANASSGEPEAAPDPLARNVRVEIL